jgi:hypothetical protein
LSVRKITYETMIRSVREKLGCGSERISDAPTALRWSWWPDRPDLQDELSSDYGMNTDFHTLEKEFREELQAIREALDQLGHEPELADWQKSSSDARRRVMQSLNQSAEALNVWDEIGVPIRRRGNTVFRIWAPRDVMGSPIIKALPADAFAIGAAEQTATDRIEIDRLKKLFENWRIAAIILAIILALIAARWIF